MFDQISYSTKDDSNDCEAINEIFENDKDKFIGQFTNKDYILMRGYINGQGEQIRLYFTKFEPKIKKATICIIHGFGEHSGKFLHIGEQFAKANYIVNILDIRGFGYSGGCRGFSSVKEMHMDIESLLKQCNSKLPLFIYAHSLGALLLITLLIRNPELNFSGIMLSSPLINVPMNRKINFQRIILLKIFHKIFREMVINAYINPTSMTKNDNLIQNFYSDRLATPFITLEMVSDILDAIEYCNKNCHKLQVPLLVLQGKMDSIVNFQKCEQFFKSYGSEDKTFKTFPNGYHELQHDIEYNEFMATMTEWAEKKMKNRVEGHFEKLQYGIPKKYNIFSFKLLLWFIIILIGIRKIRRLK